MSRDPPPELEVPLEHPWCQQIVDLGRECGVRFYVIPQNTPRTTDTMEWLDASPSPVEDDDPLTRIPLYCRMANLQTGTAGAVFLTLDNMSREVSANSFYPYHGVVVLLHEIAHAVVGPEEEFTVPWEQAALLELFPDKGGLYENLIHYEEGAGSEETLLRCHRHLEQVGIIHEGGVARRALQISDAEWQKLDQKWPQGGDPQGSLSAPTE